MSRHQEVPLSIASHGELQFFLFFFISMFLNQFLIVLSIFFSTIKSNSFIVLTAIVLFVSLMLCFVLSSAAVVWLSFEVSTLKLFNEIFLHCEMVKIENLNCRTQSGLHVTVGDDMGRIWVYDVGEALAIPSQVTN
jgi:hypothetical protein